LKVKVKSLFPRVKAKVEVEVRVLVLEPDFHLREQHNDGRYNVIRILLCDTPPGHGSNPYGSKRCLFHRSEDKNHPFCMTPSNPCHRS